MKNMKFKILLIVVCLAIGYWSLAISRVSAQDCGADLDCQIGQIQREIDALSPAHEKNKTELTNLRSQVTSLNKKIDVISVQLKKNQSEIIQREEDLGFAKALFEEKTQNHYM